jgi:hypothetical protein
MDATVAVSEGGVNKLVQELLASAVYSKSASGSWGPFTVGYSVYAAVSGGTVELVDAPIEIVRLHDFLISASVGVAFKFDLGNILPEICIPPVKVCVWTPWGTVCTPQYCVPWPSVTVPLTIPLAAKVSADFGIEVRDGGSTWNVVLLVYPFSFVLDFSPMVDVILDAIKAEVHAKLDPIPIIGSIIADLINTVIGALQSVLNAIFAAIDALIHEVVLLIDIFSPTIPVTLLSFNKVEVMIPASGPGDPDVDVILASLAAHISQHELVATTDFA